MKNTLEQVRNYLSDELYFRGINLLRFNIEDVQKDAMNDIMFDMKYEQYEAIMQYELKALMEITGDEEPIIYARNNAIILTLTISRTKLNEIPF